MQKLPFKRIQGGKGSPHNPRLTAFVYPRRGKAIMLHGYKDVVTQYILINYPVSLVHFLVNKKGKHYNVFIDKKIPFDKSMSWVEVFGISRRYHCVVMKNIIMSLDGAVDGKKIRRCSIQIIDASNRYKQQSGQRGKIVVEFFVRRFPRSWMKELDEFVDQVYEGELPWRTFMKRLQKDMDYIPNNEDKRAMEYEELKVRLLSQRAVSLA